MDEPHGATPADSADAATASAWDVFEVRLGLYLSVMTPSDRVILEFHVATGEGCAPYAVIAASDDGDTIRAELPGNRHLAPRHKLAAWHQSALWDWGWFGGVNDQPTFHREMPREQAEQMASAVVAALRDCYQILAPGQLTYLANGATAADAKVLGLVATTDIPMNISDTPDDAACIDRPTSRDHLVELARDALREWNGAEPAVDEDGDFVLDVAGHPVWLHVRRDQPAIIVMTRVVHGVASRRAAAHALDSLNRRDLWSKWCLRRRDVWQTAVVPCLPFAKEHLAGIIRKFLDTLQATRDDLAYATGGSTA